MFLQSLFFGPFEVKRGRLSRLGADQLFESGDAGDEWSVCTCS